MDIIERLEWRYAVKKFDAKRILAAEKIDKLKRAFNLTATSYGLQPMKMMVLHNKKLQEQLVAHSYGQKQLAQASHVLVICIEKNIDGEYIHNYFKQVKQIRGTSEEILNPFKEALVKDFTKKEVTEIRNWATNQAYLALGNLLTVCALEQIDSCPMEGFVPDGYDELLGLTSLGLTSVLVLPIGYRDQDDLFASLKKVRKDIDRSVIDIY
jgi:nitroreductase